MYWSCIETQKVFFIIFSMNMRFKIKLIIKIMCNIVCIQWAVVTNIRPFSQKYLRVTGQKRNSSAHYILG
jgi:hypothetical protein